MGRLAGLALCAAAYSSGMRKGRYPPGISVRLPSGGNASIQRCAAAARRASRANLPARLRSSCVAALRSSAVRLSFDEADDDQKYDRADHGINDRADEARERHESQLREQPDADESADDADDNVPDQSEPKTAHDLPGQPAGDRADDDHD